MKIRYEVPHNPDGTDPEGWDYYLLEGPYPGVPRIGDYVEWPDETGKAVEFIVTGVMWTPHRDYEVMVVLAW